jgi:predicted tellurium resistance membrane protein TerC
MESVLQEAIALIALAAMEIVLGIDNIVFISVLSSRLPPDQQPLARRIGLLAAMGTRILLLFGIFWVQKAQYPLFHLTDLGIPAGLLEGHPEVNAVTVRDLVLLLGGLFLIQSSVREIHNKIEGGHDAHGPQRAAASFSSVITQIAMMDIIFSLDSVITAVGMAEQIWVMVAAVVLAVGVMLVFATPVSNFVERHPTVKMLALSFLLLIGVMLVAEGLGTHISKGYIYFAMAFSLLVEVLNLWAHARAARRQKAAH